MSIFKVVKEHVVNNKVTYICGTSKTTLATFIADELAFDDKDVIFIDTYLGDAEFSYLGDNLVYISSIGGSCIKNIIEIVGDNIITSKIYIIIDSYETLRNTSLKQLMSFDNINFLICCNDSEISNFTIRTKNRLGEFVHGGDIYINDEYWLSHKNIHNMKYRKRNILLNKLLDDEK